MASVSGDAPLVALGPAVEGCWLGVEVAEAGTTEERPMASLRRVFCSPVEPLVEASRARKTVDTSRAGIARCGSLAL